MGQQHRVRAKRRRHQAYLKRKKIADKSKRAGSARPRPKKHAAATEPKP